jgi:hypothetical protein
MCQIQTTYKEQVYQSCLIDHLHICINNGIWQKMLLGSNDSEIAAAFTDFD